MRTASESTGVPPPVATANDRGGAGSSNSKTYAPSTYPCEIPPVDRLSQPDPGSRKSSVRRTGRPLPVTPPVGPVLPGSSAPPIWLTTTAPTPTAATSAAAMIAPLCPPALPAPASAGGGADGTSGPGGGGGACATLVAGAAGAGASIVSATGGTKPITP